MSTTSMYGDLLHSTVAQQFKTMPIAKTRLIHTLKMREQWLSLSCDLEIFRRACENYQKMLEDTTVPRNQN